MGHFAGKRTIDLNQFCSDVRRSLGKESISKVQVQEALGGIANLYLEKFLKSHRGKEVMEFGVVIGFVPCNSRLISIEEVLNEIGNCTGLGKNDSWWLLLTMNAVFRKHARQLGISRKKTVLFAPLGEFRLPLAGSIADYQVTFKDPAAQQGISYLL